MPYIQCVLHIYSQYTILYTKYLLKKVNSESKNIYIKEKGKSLSRFFRCSLERRTELMKFSNHR